MLIEHINGKTEKQHLPLLDSVVQAFASYSFWKVKISIALFMMMIIL